MNEKRRSERIPLDHEIESIFVLQDKFIVFRDTLHKIEVSYSNKNNKKHLALQALTKCLTTL
jgi:hypothetical protein